MVDMTLRPPIYLQIITQKYCIISYFLILILEMYQRNAKFSYQNHNADWQRETRGKTLISTFNMNNWIMLYTQRDERVATDFLKTLMNVAGPMGMSVNEPQR